MNVKVKLVLGLLVLGMGCGFTQRLVWIENWGSTNYYPPIRLSGDGRTVYINSDLVVRDRVLDNRIGRWREGEGWWYLQADGGVDAQSRRGDADRVWGCGVIRWECGGR
jgi:hypothetical protein